MAKSALLKSSVAKKYWMAFTGLFLCLFLTGHLAGNLQLLIPDHAHAAESFNTYARFMTSNPLVKVLSYLTYFSIIFHAIDGILLTMKNRAARPTKYAYEKPSTSSTLASRNMAVLGTLMLVFIIIHMADFWFEMHFSLKPVFKLEDGSAVKDLYIEVVEAFQSPLYVGLYVLSMVAVGFHLYHGFQSAFRSLGLYHSSYTPLIGKIGTGFSIIVPLLFAIIPIYIHFAVGGAEELKNSAEYAKHLILIPTN